METNLPFKQKIEGSSLNYFSVLKRSLTFQLATSERLTLECTTLKLKRSIY